MKLSPPEAHEAPPGPPSDPWTRPPADGDAASEPAAPTPIPTATAGTVASGPWRTLLCAGLMALIVGMCVFPAGPSLNPGKRYQYLLALTLYLPALIFGFIHMARWLELGRRPLMPWLVLLFVWSTLSLAWTNASRPLDEVLRILSVLVFLFAWLHGVGNDPRRQQWMLVGGAGVLAVTAGVAMVRFALQPPPDGRVVGMGVMANANLIAASMGAGLLWLWPWRFQTWGGRLMKWLAMGLLAACLALTESRSAWLGLFAALLVLLAARRSERAVRSVTAVSVVGMGVALAAYPELSERGWSFRPQIMQYAWSMIEQRPWTGLGLGAHFTIPVQGSAAQVHTHNLFAQIAVELGLPGLILWSCIWLGLGWRAWRCRHDLIGRIVLGVWVFASVMVQFDLPHLIDSPRPGWLIIWLPLALSLSLAPPPAEQLASR